MKKVFSLITIFLFGLLLVACNDNTPVVKNLSIDNHVLKWDKVEKAEKYIVVVGELEKEVTNNQFNLMELNLAVGEHTVGVKVVIDGKISGLSKTIKYVVDLSLQTPKNLKIIDTVVSWDSVEDATYIVVVGKETYEVSVTTFDLANLELSPGGYDVKVKAVKEGKSSAFSNIVSYVIAYEVNDNVKDKILQMYNKNYNVNMTNEDFRTAREYEVYLLRVAYLEAYIKAATVNNLPVENIYSLFDNLTKFLIEEVDIMDFDELIEYIELLESIGLKGNLLASILQQMAVMNIKIEQYNIDDIISAHQANLLSHMDIFNGYKEDLNYKDIVNTLNKYATNEEETLAVLELTNSFKSDVLMELYFIIREVNNNNDFAYDGYADESFVHFTKVIRNLYTSNNEQDIEFMNTYNISFFIIANYASNIGSAIESYEEMISLLEKNKVTNTLLVEMLEEEKEVFIKAVESVYDFVVVMKNTLNSEQLNQIMNKLFAGETLTIAEVIIIKDVILPVVKNSVPSEKELEDVYKLLFTIINESSFNGNYDEFLEYASVMAQQTLITIETILEFVEKIDEKYLNEVKNMLSNEQGVIEVLIYTLEYYEDFITEIKGRYDEVLTEEEIEALYVLFFDMIIEANMEFGNLEDIEILIVVRDNYKLFSKFFNQYSNKAIPLIISLTKVYSSVNEINIEFTSELFADLILEVVNLDSIIFSDFNEENLTTILELLKFVVNIDFNETFKEEIDPLIQVVLSLNEIKTKILVEANKLEADLYFEHPGLATGDYKEMQYKIIYYVTTALNNVLTEEVKTELESLIDILVDDVLTNEDIKESLGLAEFDLSELKIGLKETVSYYIDVISLLAGYDYNNLTLEQWETLEMFADQIFGNENYEYNFADAVKVNASEIETITTVDLYGPLVYEIVFYQTGHYEYQLINSESNLFVELFVLDNDGVMYLLGASDGIYSSLYLDLEYVYYLVIQEEYGGPITIQMQFGPA